MRARLLLPVALLALSACSCGERLVFFDDVEVYDGPLEEAPESLHVYASNARFTLRVRSADAFFAIDQHGGAVTSGSVVQLDDSEISEVIDGVIQIPLATRSAGTGTVGLLDAGGQLVGEREITVKDADSLEIAVTAPEREGFALPEVDVASVRVFSGGSAGFRTTLLADGEEIFGTHAVEGAAEDDRVSARPAGGCALEGCSSPRSAVVLSVPTGVSQATDVELSAGEASLTLTVVPTGIDEITSLAAEAIVDEEIVSGASFLPLHVLAGDEPVFGAPVAWRVDDVEVEGSGDTLRFAPAASDDSVAVASLGELEVTTTIEGGAADPSVTSITAACGQTGGGRAAMAPLWLLGIVLLGARSRHR